MINDETQEPDEATQRLTGKLLDKLNARIALLESRLAQATSFESGFGWHIFKRSNEEWVLTIWNYSGERTYTTQDEAFAMVEGAKL